MNSVSALRALAGMMAAGLLSACSAAAPLNALANKGPWTVRSSQYAEGPRQGVDVYTPAGATRRPVIVFFYGGNWDSGDKASYRFVAASLAERGYVVVVPDYRVYPQVRFDGFMQDGAQAVAWTKRNIAKFGGDASRVFVMGHSAGAHIAAMLALDERWLGAVGLTPRRDIAGLIGVAGPYDFLPLGSAKLRDIFSGGDIARTQPINFANGNEPPALLLHGSGDTTVEPGNTARLATRLRAKGNDARAIIYPNVGHADIIGAVSPLLKQIAPVVDDVDRFVRSHSGGRARDIKRSAS
jgi:acetyl esterase/lipase